jgi:hypothetical protein
MVWVGTERPVPVLVCTKDRDAAGDYAHVEPVAPDAEVRRQVRSPCVTYVGSHEGCGCGFNSSLLDFEGFDDEAEPAPLLGALREDERDEYVAERRSREHLHALLVSALVEGPVIVHACWAGDEGEAPDAVEEVDASWLLTRTSPLKEGVQYKVTRPLT